MKAKEIFERLMADGTHGQAGDPEPQEPEQKVMTIGEILALLPKQAQSQVEQILSTPQDPFEAARKLKPIFAPHAAVLEQHGLVADYLAYALPYHAYKRHQQ